MIAIDLNIFLVEYNSTVLHNNTQINLMEEIKNEA